MHAIIKNIDRRHPSFVYPACRFCSSGICAASQDSHVGKLIGKRKTRKRPCTSATASSATAKRRRARRDRALF